MVVFCETCPSTYKFRSVVLIFQASRSPMLLKFVRVAKCYSFSVDTFCISRFCVTLRIKQGLFLQTSINQLILEMVEDSEHLRIIYTSFNVVCLFVC